MSWNFTKYPDNWEKMRKAIFSKYGGKYCLKGIFKKFGHKGYVHLHHYVPLSKSKNKSEYYFLNQPWNLVMLCEKHHNQYHSHMNSIKGSYDYYYSSKKKSIGYGKRFYWHAKRRHYFNKFNDRDADERILFFWNYWKWGEKRLKKKMLKWPKKYLEELV